jgi:hypothetical protein
MELREHGTGCAKIEMLRGCILLNAGESDGRDEFERKEKIEMKFLRADERKLLYLVGPVFH